MHEFSKHLQRCGKVVFVALTCIFLFCLGDIAAFGKSVPPLTDSGFMQNYGNPDFEIDGGGFLVKYNGTAKDVIIPDGVVGVLEDAFAGNAFITSIYFPKSIKYSLYGSDFFSGCTSLNKLTIPNSLSFHGSVILNDYPTIKELTIYPNNGDTILHGPYGRNSTIEKVNINFGFTGLGAWVFNEWSTLKEVNLPASLKVIADNTFSGCQKLTAIHFPQGLERIGGYAFEGCIGLTGLEIPNSVKGLEVGAFKDCVNITKVKLPNGLGDLMSTFPALDTMHFTLSQHTSTLQCPFVDVENIIIDEGITEISFGGRHYYGSVDLTCPTRVKELIFPSSLEEIRGDASIQCPLLESITIRGSIRWVDSAFEECPYLKSATVSIYGGPEPLYHCDVPQKIETLTLEKGITEVGELCFNDLTLLKTLNLPDTLETIGSDCFNNAGSLENLRLPKGLVEIGGRSFNNAVMLSEIALPSNELYFDWYFLDGCPNLKIMNVFFSGNPVFETNGLHHPFEEIYFDEGITKIDGRLL